jgi:DNA-binding transcriptional LysR family regulator
MTFDIRQLRYAIAAADHGSFYRAARALDIEQSTLSRNILRLESAIGAKLFLRSRAGVTTTIPGAEFIRDARHIVARADRLLSNMRAAGQGRAGGLSVGHNGPISAGNFRATILAWRRSWPDVEVDGVEADREALLAGLDGGIVDVAILAGDASYDGLRRASFWSERTLVAMSALHPLANRETIHWTDLRDETFLLPMGDPGPEMRDMILSELATAGYRPKIKMQSISRESIMSVLGGGPYVTITCEGASGAQYPDVITRPVHGPHGQTMIGFTGYWRSDNENPAMRRFLEFTKERYALSFDFSESFQ